MTSHISQNTIDAVSEEDATIMQSAIDAAVLEAQGYCSRYRVDQLFENIDSDPDYSRDSILLLHVKNMARWHFITLSNPTIDYEDAELRYNQAIKWLMGVQKGTIVPPSWPPLEEPEYGNKLFHISSRPKRNNHY